MKIQKIGDIWKELEKMKRMPPAGTFFDYSFRNDSQLKMGVSLFMGISISNSY
jgi:hypothetical protein